MLRGSDAKRGYMRWWHSFQGVCPTTQETRTFFVEYSILNPALGAAQPILGQHPYYRRHGNTRLRSISRWYLLQA